MELTKDLVKTSLERTNAHGLGRLVSERRIYTRILWLLAWLVCCGFFITQLVGFVTRLTANEVTTNFQAGAVLFEYPDLYFCFDNPVSGSRHIAMRAQAAARIKASFSESIAVVNKWATMMSPGEFQNIKEGNAAAVQMNSLSYRLLFDELGHIAKQAVLFAILARSSGLAYITQRLSVEEFYHPRHLRCFRVALNSTQRVELRFAGPGDTLYFLLMLDAPDGRMGRRELPVVQTPRRNLTAPYWALDKDTLSSRVQLPLVRLYVTEPRHYPGNFDSILLLEAGRTYIAKLTMTEQVHKEDPSRCVEQHPDVQIVNPYDHSAYTVAYDYAFCYNSAVQAQFQRELNATCAFLPHPWPPASRSVYNLSSGWGSAQDVRMYLRGRERLSPDEPQRVCATRHRCTERLYTASVNSVIWPSLDSFQIFMTEMEGLFPEDSSHAPALHHLSRLAAHKNLSQLAAEFVRANFLQLQLSAARPAADRTIYTRDYSFASFVADVGGILGIYLGMSLLTVCELLQFLHDLVLLAVFVHRGGESTVSTERNSSVSLEENELGV